MIRNSVRAQNCPVAKAHRSFRTRSMIRNRYNNFCGYNVSGNARHMAAMNDIIPICTMVAMSGDNSDDDDDDDGTVLFSTTDAAWNSPLA